MRIFLTLLLSLTAFFPANASRPAPVVHHAEIAGSIEDVWATLTTQQGVLTFFAQEAVVEPEVGGMYELYFLLENEAGRRGTEGVRILAMEAPNRFFISWNAPPRFGALRNQRTVVEFQLTPLGEDRTLIILNHSGWGMTDEWQTIRDYFGNAWRYVLGNLQYRFDNGPIDWSEAPNGTEYYRPAGG